MKCNLVDGLKKKNGIKGLFKALKRKPSVVDAPVDLEQTRKSATYTAVSKDQAAAFEKDALGCASIRDRFSVEVMYI